jgi:hemolysin activation/secretion protein
MLNVPSRATRFLLVAMAGLVWSPAETVAQTAAKAVPPDRPDQGRAPSRPQGNAPRYARARNADIPIRPFVLTDVVVDDSSLPAERFHDKLARFVGQTVDSKGLAAIVNAAAEVYADSDIALYSVLVPEQSFAGGHLRLSAIEGAVGAVEVRGNINPHRKDELQTYLRRISRERPLTKPTLERNVSEIRLLPGFVPDLRFSAGAAPGEVKLEVAGKDPRFQVALGVNNRGTAFLGKTQVQADLFVNAPLTGSDQLRATVVLPTDPELFQYYALSYASGIGTHGTSFSVFGSRLRTRPKLIPLKGGAWAYGGQLNQTLVRDYRNTLSFTLGVDAIDSNNALLGQTFSNDRIRSGRLGASFSRTTTRNYFALNATLSAGLPFLGERVNPLVSDRKFVKLSGRLTFNQQIGRDFLTRLSGFGQLTDNRLPSSEQLSLGGEEFGRAYEASIVSGDKGYAGSLELAWHPQSGLPKLLNGSEIYAYIDGGRVIYRDRGGAGDFRSDIASVGGGVRAAIADRAVLQIEATRGLINPVFYENHKRVRVVFSLRTIL